MTEPNQAQGLQGGSLQEIPFGKVFFRLAREKKTGYLDILSQAPPAGKVLKRIMIASGGSFYVQGGNLEETMARILVTRGKLTEQKYEELKTTVGGDYQKLEQAAQAAANLAGQDLSELYQHQTELKIINCFALIRGYYQFREVDLNELNQHPLISLGAEKLLLSGVKAHYPKARIDNEFAGIEGKHFQVNPKLIDQAVQFGFGPKEVRWMHQLGKEFAFAAGLRLSPLKPEPAIQVLLALYLAGYFELPEAEENFPLGSVYGESDTVKKIRQAGEKKIEDKKSAQEKKAAPPPEDPKLPIEKMLDQEMDDRQLVKKIEEMLDLVSKKETTFLEIMGVDERASPAQIKKIYFKMAKIFHPDAKPDLYQGDLRDKVEDLFTRISEAYSTLTEPELRKAYLERIKSTVTDEEMEKANRALQAEMEFQKAMISIRRGAFREAQASLETAADLVPDEPEYKLHLGYCLFKSEGAGAANKAIKMIEEGLKQRPQVSEGWFYLGVINRVQGNLGEARSAFQKTLELDKHSQEAQRELRVIEMKIAEGGKGGRKR